MIFPHDLLLSFQTGRVRLFVGSGVSARSGLTGWNSLIELMRETIRRENRNFKTEDVEEFLASGDHLDIADAFRELVKEHRYFRFLREHYRKDVAVSDVHELITRLPVKTILTTNYDKLLETAFRVKNGYDPPVIIFPEQLGYIDETETRIIKLHGDIDHPLSIVLTKADYTKYEQRRRDFVQVFQDSINNYSLLFIGFGLRDPNFESIYQDARHFYDTTKRLSYAIMTGVNGVKRGLWEKDGLVILPLADHAELPACLTGLVHEVR